MELQRQKVPMENLRKEIENIERAYRKLQAQQKISNFVGDAKTKIGILGKKTIGKVVNTAKTVAVAGGITGGMLGYSSTGAYVEFNASMKKVQAISGATQEDFIKLEKEAMRLGATTKFTSKESADAMEKMALAGFNTTQIIQSMSGVLDLAAASGEDVAMVSDIITDNLTAFKMEAKDTVRFADVLAWGMSKTNVNIQMLGKSFEYISGTASNLGLSLEEMVGTLGLMGDQAIKSGMAGTSLDNAFKELIRKKELLKQIGINIENKKGDFIGIAQTVKQFEKHTKKMSQIQKAAFLQNVFGAEGQRSFSKLLSAQKTINGVTYKGAEAVAKTIEEAQKSSVGMATKMKNTMLEGASGTQTLLSSAWDGLKIAIGRQILSDNNLKYIRKLTEIIGELANVINGSFSNNKYNLFWKGFIDTAKHYLDRLVEAFKPAIVSIKNMLGSSGGFGVFKILGEILIQVGRGFSFIVQAIELFNNVVGIDKLLIFIGAFLSINKALSTFNMIKNGFKVFQEMQGTFNVLKIVVEALGGWIPLVIAGVVTLGYIVYKNWDIVKKLVTFIVEIIKQCGNYIVDTFVWVVDKLKYINPLWWIYKFVKIIYMNFDAIKLYLSDVLDVISNYFIRWFDSILKIPELLKTAFIEAFNFVKQNILEVWESVKKLPLINRFFAEEEKRKVDGSHRNGLGYVPYDGYIAELHKGERVLTTQENKEYGTLFNRLTTPTTTGITNNNSTANYVFKPQIIINTNNGDNTSGLVEQLQQKIRELEREFINKIREMERGYGRTSF